MVLKEVLGYPNVKNYDGSWVEWSSIDSLPTEIGVINPLDQASYGQIFIDSSMGYLNYIIDQVTFQSTPWFENYFWFLVVLSLLVWVLEILFPWRKNQSIFRKDFWLDFFFMFFNFYIFNLVIFIAFSKFVTKLIYDISGADITGVSVFDMSGLGWGWQMLIFFLATDFIQWFTHVLLHRFEFLWRFHKVHHSVEEMGFAAHLRYHWMETVFYTPMKFIAVMFIGGFAPEQAFIIYFFTIAVGHLNHANLGWSYGPLKYIFNNPKMHIWHHAKDLPNERRFGVNFGITLSVWDYIFGKNYIPSSGRDIPLGFSGMEKFPKRFLGLISSGFTKTSKQE
jgi:sterol desaturase/sphingolipid hydroxylase (fatty acid hydroxylase superfamily)